MYHCIKLYLKSYNLIEYGNIKIQKHTHTQAKICGQKMTSNTFKSKTMLVKKEEIDSLVEFVLSFDCTECNTFKLTTLEPMYT